MQLMVKGGVKRWIPDVFIGYYRELGYTVEGEETPSPDQGQPEQVTAADADDQTAEETPEDGAPAGQDDEQPGETGDEQQDDQTAEETPEEADPVFICPHCGKEYKSESSLKGHITRSHGGEQ